MTNTALGTQDLRRIDYEELSYPQSIAVHITQPSISPESTSTLLPLHSEVLFDRSLTDARHGFLVST